MRKSWKRRLRRLEKERGRPEIVDKAIVNLEENFDQDELEAAKVFVVDILNWSGPLSRLSRVVQKEVTGWKETR